MSAGRVVLLDHSFHDKTLSSSFFVEAWRKADFEVVILLDDSWKEGQGVLCEEIDQHSPDLVVSWQILKPARFYRGLRCRRVVLVPMYDSSSGMKDRDWIQYREFAFLHFSRRLFDRLARLGMVGQYLQYFPDPTSLPSVPFEQKSNSVFFWQRRSRLGLKTIVPIATNLTGMDRPRVHWHKCLDPGETEEPGAGDAPAAEITETKWFRTREELLLTVARHRFFVAPRLQEGIGMSFLEAIAMGSVVIAHTDATMDEYLEHGVNGVLCDFAEERVEPFRADLSWKEVSDQAVRDSVRGHNRWTNDCRAWIASWQSWSSLSPTWTIPALLSSAEYTLWKYMMRPSKRLLTKLRPRHAR